MKDFEKIKGFFIDHLDRFVAYNVITKEEKDKETHLTEYVAKNIVRNPSVKDYFVLNFPFDSGKDLVDIDSLDSFVFDFYFIDYGDKIVIDDACRTFECGVEAYEGNGVLVQQSKKVDRYLEKNGLSWAEGSITCQTSMQTFVQDTITFVRVLQTLNNIQPYPPYILELDDAKEVVDVLTRCWVKGEKITDGKSTRKLALFDNWKNLSKGRSCAEKSYPIFDNKNKFVCLFFNQDGKVLIRKSTKEGDALYDFAIVGFILKDEWSSLVGLQREIQETFRFDFFFGEVAPVVSTIRNKVITDFYVINDYNVTIEEITNGDGKFIFDWVTKDEIVALIKSGDFGDYSLKLIEYLYEIKENS